MTTEPSVTGELEATLEGIDNPIERLKLLAGNDDERAVPRHDRGHQPA